MEEKIHLEKFNIYKKIPVVGSGYDLRNGAHTL
jgi:hypothetical protein